MKKERNNTMTNRKTHTTRLLVLALACAVLLMLFPCLSACSSEEYNTPVAEKSYCYESWPTTLYFNKYGFPVKRILHTQLLNASQNTINEWRYDNKGKLISYISTSPNESKTIYTFTYDAQGRPLHGVGYNDVHFPTGTSCSFFYHENGSYTVSWFYYDSLQRQEVFDGTHTLICQYYVGSDCIWYDYTAQGALYRIRYDDGAVVTLTLDENGRTVERLLQEKDGSKQHTRYEYAQGKISRYTTSNVPVGRYEVRWDRDFTYTYQENGLMLERHIRETANEAATYYRTCLFSYDEVGRLVAYTEKRGDEPALQVPTSGGEYTFDGDGRCIESKTYTYYEDGKRTANKWIYTYEGKIKRESNFHSFEAVRYNVPDDEIVYDLAKRTYTHQEQKELNMYDENWNLVLWEFASRRLEGCLLKENRCRSVRSYDKAGNLVKNTLYLIDENGTIQKEEEHTYHYDQFHRLVNEYTEEWSTITGKHLNSTHTRFVYDEYGLREKTS